MKRNTKRLALVAQANVRTDVPQTREERLEAAKEWLGPRHVLSADYKPRVRVGFFLTAWAAEYARSRETGRPAA